MLKAAAEHIKRVHSVVHGRLMSAHAPGTAPNRTLDLVSASPACSAACDAPVTDVLTNTSSTQATATIPKLCLQPTYVSARIA